MLNRNHTYLGALLEPEQVGEDAAAAALDDPRLAGAQQRQQAVQEAVLQYLPFATTGAFEMMSGTRNSRIKTPIAKLYARSGSIHLKICAERHSTDVARIAIRA